MTKCDGINHINDINNEIKQTYLQAGCLLLTTNLRVKLVTSG